MYDDMVCKLRRINGRRELNNRRVIWPAFRVTWMFEKHVQEYCESDGDKCETMFECQRVFSVHLGVLPNKYQNPKYTQWSIWVPRENDQEDCRWCLRLSRCTGALDLPSMAKIMHQLLFVIMFYPSPNKQSFSSTFYPLPRCILEPK